MDPVELEKLAKVGAHLLLDVPIPPVGGEAIRPIVVFVQGDVVWAFEFDDVFSFRLIVNEASRARILDQGEAHFRTCGAQGVDVFDLCLDRCEVTHNVPSYFVVACGPLFAILQPLANQNNAVNPREGLRLARLFMVLSSLMPLFVLWAVRGVPGIPEHFLISGCALLAIVPTLVLWLRMWIARKNSDKRTLRIGQATDHREHLLVYLFAVLLPLYDANLEARREIAATLLAFTFIVFLFWHLNLHYMNLVFALAGYRVFTIHAEARDPFSAKTPFVLITRRQLPQQGDELTAYRISNTVYYEP